MVRLLAVALAIVAARATNDGSPRDLYKKKEPHASVTNAFNELRVDAESKADDAQLAEAAVLAGQCAPEEAAAAATAQLNAESEVERAWELIGHIDKNTPPEKVRAT